MTFLNKLRIHAGVNEGDKSNSKSRPATVIEPPPQLPEKNIQSQIRVRHMEIDSLNKYFRKIYIYGRSGQKYRRIVNARSLTNQERFLVYRRTVQSGKYTWLKTISLLCLLTVAFSYWVSGTVGNGLNFKQKVQ